MSIQYCVLLEMQAEFTCYLESLLKYDTKILHWAKIIVYTKGKGNYINMKIVKQVSVTGE